MRFVSPFELAFKIERHPKPPYTNIKAWVHQQSQSNRLIRRMGSNSRPKDYWDYPISIMEEGKLISVRENHTSEVERSPRPFNLN